MRNIREIVKEPHPVLRAKARDIDVAEIGSPLIQDLIESMKKTLQATIDGVGLAAAQVGQGLRIFIVSDEAEEIDRLAADTHVRKENSVSDEGKQYPVREWNYYVFINPRVTSISRKKLNGSEGCLSVPGLFGTVSRSEKIRVEAYDEHGKKIIRGASRFFARVMQHELDHLDGTLFIDKATHVVHVKNGNNE
ncbi:MAG: peptide deformylase [bacterium]|nr:peptide deformylase [bacterium]